MIDCGNSFKQHTIATEIGRKQQLKMQITNKFTKFLLVRDTKHQADEMSRMRIIIFGTSIHLSQHIIITIWKKNQSNKSSSKGKKVCELEHAK